ncbi:MAG: hypothetical protein MAGBODY4_01464 [Candidatus Marinimicrobia bacterium]|nr:hypothetical protein [Candidatus Neomarinimicrobiota bacterium]
MSVILKYGMPVAQKLPGIGQFFGEEVPDCKMFRKHHVAIYLTRSMKAKEKGIAIDILGGSL